jgi:hypothetical protein
MFHTIRIITNSMYSMYHLFQFIELSHFYMFQTYQQPKYHLLHIYILPLDDELLIRPKHVAGVITQ